MSLNKNMYTAFTLAEVLITLAIIGVIAAMTIPSLVSNTQKIEDFTKLKKAFSVLSQAAEQIRDDNGGDFTNIIDSASTNTSLDFANLFKAKMRVSNFCTGNGDDTNCWISDTSVVRNLTNTANYGGNSNTYAQYPKLITTDSLVYIFKMEDPTCSGDKYRRNNEYEFCGDIIVDINGAKSPNTIGKDIFSFSVNKYNLTPYLDYRQSTYLIFCDKNSSYNWNGAECATRAINAGKIDYY